jgi:hypothetical protein
MIESDSASRQPIEMGGADFAVACASERPTCLIVGENKDNVRFRRCAAHRFVSFLFKM